MAQVNSKTEIQKLLKDVGYYTGPIDGIFGIATFDAINKYLQLKNINYKWTRARKAKAMEQLLYQSLGIEVGTIDGLEGQMLQHAREVYEASLVTTWRDKADVIYPPKVSKEKISLQDINIYQLAFIRGIGETETGFSKKEAYSEAYNKSTNNKNVKQYGQDGADYGYYQNNNLDVKQLINSGVDVEVAKHLNGGGKGGNSSIEEQTLAMHYRLKMKYSEVYENIKDGSMQSFQVATKTMRNHWFGLQDRPEVALAAWKKAASNDYSQIFPEVFKKKTEVTVSNTNWPRQSDVPNFFGNVGTRQVKCQVPFTMVLAWDTKTKLTTYSCHELVKEPMERIWNRTLEHYGYDKIVDLRLHYFGGCLNVRKMRGGSSWSMNSWGIAVDIDPDRNALRTPWKKAQMSKPEYEPFVQFWYDEGFINLGKERDFDAMHYQAALL